MAGTERLSIRIHSINAERVPAAHRRASAHYTSTSGFLLALRRIRIRSGGVLLSSHRAPSHPPLNRIDDARPVVVVIVYAGF